MIKAALLSTTMWLALPAQADTISFHISGSIFSQIVPCGPFGCPISGSLIADSDTHELTLDLIDARGLHNIDIFGTQNRWQIGPYQVVLDRGAGELFGPWFDHPNIAGVVGNSGRGSYMDFGYTAPAHAPAPVVGAGISGLLVLGFAFLLAYGGRVMKAGKP